MEFRFARFLLIFAALWLPVQTMAGMAVSVCMNMHSHDGQVLQHQGIADATAATPCHEAVPDDQAAQHDSCDNCEICHLASAGFMPSAAPDPGLMPTGRHFALAPLTAPPSFIAEPPQQPPRHAD